MKADLVLKSNAIFDSISRTPTEGFVAISGNKIAGIGDLKEAENFIGSDTKVYDLKDKLVIPGFHDSHVHLVMAGMYQIYANLADAKSEEEACKMLKEFEDRRTSNPSKDEWVIGFGWYHVFWNNKNIPTKESLDKYFPDRPVFLLNAEAHGAWVNSKALEIAGITKNTPDPFGGTFNRDEQGNPTGFLYEGAVGAVSKYAMDFSDQQIKRFLKAFMDAAAPLGITSVNDVQPYFHGNIGDVKVYSEMDKDGELTVRINVAQDLLGNLDKVMDDSVKYKSEKIRAHMLKQFLDGVSTTHTALVIEDYTDAPGNRGISLSPLDAIEAAVPEAHKRGLSIKLHSCGDMSARLALDYYENAIKKYGKNQCRHAIEHIELIDESDIPRIKELEIIPSMQPEHLAMTQTFAENPYPVTLGEERAYRGWPLKSMLKNAGVIAIGSDCPVVDNNPFLEIFRAVTRVHNDGEPKGGWNPSEKLTMEEVLTGYTYGSAYGVCREDDLGSLEVGKFADIAVIDRNLFTLENPWDILESKVDMTIMDGEVIFER